MTTQFTDLDVSKIILKHWGIASAARPENSGGSRATWQLENGNWISRSGAGGADPFRSESTLLGLLRESLIAQKVAIAVPEIVRNLRGLDVTTDEGCVWRMTKNIPSIKFPASDLRTYPVLVEALDSLHLALREIPLETTPIKIGVVEGLFNFFGRRDEAPVVLRAISWLEPRLDILRSLPAAATHGDFNPSNLIYSDDRGQPAVVGIIDFELSRPDPIVMDYSQLLTMIVCHSGVPNLAVEAARLFSRLVDRFTALQLCTAMAAYWVDLYFRWKAHDIAEARFRMRLGQVMNFVEQLA